MSSQGQARELLEEQLKQLGELRNASTRDAGFKQWRQSTLTVIQRIWPTDPTRSERFRRVPFSAPSSRMDPNQSREFYERGCGEAGVYLRLLIEELEGKPAANAGSPPARGAATPRSAGSPGDGASRAGTTLGPTIDLPLRPSALPAEPRAAAPARAAAEPEPHAEAVEDDPHGSKPGSLKELLGLGDLTAPAREPSAEVFREPARETFREPIEAVEPPLPPARSPLLAPPATSHEPADVELGAEEEPADAPALMSEPEPTEPPAFASEPAPPPPSLVTREPDRPVRKQEVDAASEFLRTSPVLAAEGKPVHRAPRPAAAPPSAPAALALGALSSDLARLGVPEGQRASARAALLDLGRQIQEGTLTWQDLRGAVTFVMGFPPLARQVLPLLLPYLDRDV